MNRASERIGGWRGGSRAVRVCGVTALVTLFLVSQSVTARPLLVASAPVSNTGNESEPALHPVAVGTRLEKVGTSTLLSFDLSQSTSVRSYALEGPDRIVIEAPEINFQLGPEVGRTRQDSVGLIKSFRFGQFVPGKSRIVIDLAAPARIESVSVSPIAAGDPSRLTIRLARSDRASFHESVSRNSPPDVAILPIDSLHSVLAGEDRPVIVLDPGHGGIDPGASGVGGAQEKRLVFDFATALAEKLNGSGRYKVVLTRNGDEFVSLADRVKVARAAKASLFVSVHADTLAGGPEVTGATIYTVSDTASDAEAARVAESENRADEEAGLEAAPDATDVSDILYDLTRRETRTFSHSFQRTLTGYWRKIARLNKNPERSAGFKVLRAPDVPSVLLELGYLSSEKDVAALTSPDWRNKATASVAASIDTFFAGRAPSEQTVTGQLETKSGDPDKTAIVVLRPHL